MQKNTLIFQLEEKKPVSVDINDKGTQGKGKKKQNNNGNKTLVCLHRVFLQYVIVSMMINYRLWISGDLKIIMVFIVL